MKPQRIVLLDIGARPRFARSLLAARWAVQCLASPETRLRPMLGQLREATSRDPWEIAQYVLYPTRLLHVMAHGAADAYLEADRRLGWP